MTSHARLETHETSTLYDAARRLGIDAGLAGVAPLAPGMKVVGPAYTVRFVSKTSGPAGPGSFYDVMAAAPAASVLVVQVGAPRWISGANMSCFAQHSGLAGIVTDGCVRDVAVQRSRSFPIFSKGVSVQGYSELLSLGESNIEIECGGLQVSPNDVVVGDDDGVVVLPRARVAEILYEADEIVQLDHQLAAAIEARMPLRALDALRLQWARRRLR
ncbi:RraA family protein [Variovorax sp. RCC_210]|uniref:RraA family protein n=1 Tax=Variovorax sp. RCC_210 TaxID=3239217 RepID=UPI003523471E